MGIVVYIGGAVLFFALVMASIALHEAGHMFWGKLFGVKTTQFFIGFGRTLWSFRPTIAGKRSETEYGLKLVPLGGFVRFTGMLPPARTDLPGTIRASSTGIFSSMAEHARAAEWEEITPQDNGRLFYQKKPWQKLVIMAGGPVMNLLIAFVIFVVLVGSQGIQQGSLTVQSVSECVLTADSGHTTCQAGDPVSPAYAMGIRAGDKIVSFNGTPIKSWDQLSGLIRDNLDHPATVVVDRNGARTELPTTNTVVNGVTSKWDPENIVKAGFLGVTPTREIVRGGPLLAVKVMWNYTERTVYFLGQFPVRVYDVAANLIGGKPRDVNGPMSIVGASRVAGEVASTSKLVVGEKVATFASLLGSVNLFVGLFNFVPLLPLDGGHIVGALYEMVRRLLSRVFKLRHGGYFDIAKLMPLTYLIAGFILICGVVLVVADVIDPIRLF